MSSRIKSNPSLARSGAALLLGFALALPSQAALVGSYSFEESPGATTAAPTVGTVSGALNGLASFAPGAGINGSGALSLSRGGLVDMGNNFGFASSYSIAIWVKLANGDANVQVPFGKHVAGAGVGYFMAIGNAGDGCCAAGVAQLYPGSYPLVGGTTPVNDGAWHQLIGTFDAAAQVAALYVDGQLQNSVAGAGTQINTTSFLLGGTTAGPTYDGLLDELRIFDNALTAAEVRTLYGDAGNGNDIPEPATAWLLALGLLAAVPSSVQRRRGLRLKAKNAT